jgi:hypothetical protein
MTGKDDDKTANNSYLLSDAIISLIYEERFDEARSLIIKERERLPEAESHRLTALSAVLYKKVGEGGKGIALMKLALRENPTWLPHLFRLSVMLMDEERWEDADVLLCELVALSLAKDEIYFLSEGRLRRALCLSMLGRADDLKKLKAEIGPGESAFIGDKLYRIEDIQ